MRRFVHSTMTMTLTLAALGSAAVSGWGVTLVRAETPDSTAPYSVQDGNKVDPKTLAGWKTWRALACERCHGAEQEGLVGPSLVNSLKVLTKEEFHNTVINGRAEKGMPPWGGSDMMQKNWEGLYGYLKGRSDGNIKPGHLYPIGP